MQNETKKTIAIIILSLVIIGLLFIIFSGDSQSKAIIKQIREQLTQSLRSNEIIELENSKIREESEQLRADYIKSEENNLKSENCNKQLTNQNNEYRNIIKELTAGSQETENILSEYGRINGEFTEFIRQNEHTE